MSSCIPEIYIHSPSGNADDSNGSGRNYLNRVGCVNGNFNEFHQKQFMFGIKNAELPRRVQMVKWENTVHLRPFNLASFSTSTMMYRTAYRSHAVALNKAKLGFNSGSAKSLDILRQNLQKSINKEIDDIIQKYLEKFFKPGIENIRTNNGENSVSEQHIQSVCKQILEEAKKMYHGNQTRGNSPAIDFSDSEYHSPPETKSGRIMHKATSRKRKDSDTDSEASQNLFKPKKKKGRQPIHYHGNISGRSTPSKLKVVDSVKREGPRWDPARLTAETHFIMGAKANKALGLGATRGRLYIKHPDIFKYSGDQEDKLWLYEHNQMPATGGKAYMLLVEDIRHLAESEEYRNSPGLMMNEIVGFTVPETMLQKMKVAMQLMRTDVTVRRRGRPPLNVDSTNSVQASLKSDVQTVKSEEISQIEQPDASSVDDVDLLGAEMPSNDPSPFSLGTAFDDVSPAQPEASPSPSEFSTTLDPPLSAPFDITTP